MIALAIAAGLGIAALSRYSGYLVAVMLIAGFPFGLWALLQLWANVGRFGSLIAHLRWWHLLWLLVFLSALVFRIRDVDSIRQNPLDAWALYRLAAMGAVGLVLLARLAIGKTDWIKSVLQGVIGLMAGFALINLLSSIWSVHALWTLYKSVELLIDVMLVAAVVAAVKSDLEFKTLFDWTWSLMALFLAAVWLGVLLWPAEAVVRGVGTLGIQIEGVVPQLAANSVGDLGATFAIVSFTRLLFPTKRKGLYVLVFLVAIATLIMAQSRSPLTGFLIAVPLILFAARRIHVAAVLVMVLPIVVHLAGADKLFWEYFLRGQNPALFGSFTGRVTWWDAGWEVFRKQPLIGLGGYAGPRFEVSEGFDPELHALHNTWIEVLVGVGILGFISLLAVVLATWTILLRFPPREATGTVLHRLHVEALGLLVLLSIRSYFSESFIWHDAVQNLPFLLVLGYAEFLRRLNKQRSRESFLFSRHIISRMNHSVSSTGI